MLELNKPTSLVQQVSGSKFHTDNDTHTKEMKVAAEYLAKGYSLSDKVLQNAIEMDRASIEIPQQFAHAHDVTDKQGISAKFLDYFRQLDQKIGRRAFGPEHTVSTAIQSKVDEQIKQTKAIDEEKGYSKVAHGVRVFL